MSFNNTKTPNKPTTPAKWQIPTRPKYKAGKDEYYLEGELKERFCKLFPKNSNRRMMTWFGIGFSTLQRFKRELGLEKDMKAIRKQQAKDTKKICERSGYYDSLRGKAPSEACIEAIRRRHAAGFCPVKQLKANNPRKYKRMLRKKSEQCKELWHKERRRAFYGLERKTPPSCSHHSAIIQGFGSETCYDTPVQLLCRPIRRPSRYLLRQRDTAVSTTRGNGCKAWVEGSGSG